MKKIFTFLCVVLFCVWGQASWGQVYVHNFGTSTITAHPYTVAPTTLNANLSGSSWSNSASAWTSFAGSAGQAITLNNSGGTPTITLTFNVASGYKLDVTSYSFWRQRSTSGAQNWSMTISGNAVGSGTIPTSGANTGNITTNLPLSNLTGTVTIVISLSGASGTGNVRLDDFTLNGSVTSTSTPTITLSSPSQIASGNIAQCSTNNALSAFQASVTVANAILNSVAVTTAGTYSASSHFSNFKLLYNTTTTFAGATQIGATQTSVASGGTITFGSLTQNITNGGTGFFWIVADVNASATASETINITASPTLTFASGSPTGTITAGGVQTITSSGVTAPTGVSASSGNAQSIVAWTNPTCFEEIMIVGKQGVFTSATPTGDGTAYTASLIFGSGTAFDGGFVVYKGSSSSQTVTNLTNCLAYEFKIFARKGTTWSAGVTANATPTSTASSLSDVVGVASSEANTISSLMNTATISTATDGVQVWQITIRDGGASGDADCLPTIVNSILLTQSGGNGVTNWNNIQSIAIFNGSTFLANGTVATSSVTFSASPLISVPDNGSVTLSIRMSLKSTLSIPATADGLDFGFSLTSANFTTTSSATSSQKATASFPVISTNAQNVIEVIATKLAFITQPSNSTVGATMTSPTVEAEDANGNRDRDYVATIDIVSTGSLDVTPKTATPASGLATFSNIVHTVSGIGLTLTATSGSLTSAVSNTFNISVVINSETFGTCGSLTWNAVNVLGATDVWSCGTSQMLMNGFGSENDEDWLIIATPVNFNVYANESMAFVTRERYDGPNLQLFYSTNFSGTFDASNVSSATWTLIPHTWNDTSTGATLSAAFNNTVDLSALTGTAYIAFKYTGTSGSAEEWIVDNIAITGNITTPTLVASPTSRTGFTYAQGAGPSTSQSFNLSGVNLTPSAGNITLVPPTNYEISTDNATFTSSNVVIAYTGSALASTPIYIRLKAGLTVGNYNGELINISGGGATAVDVSCSGNVFIMPQVVLSSTNPSVVASNIEQGATNQVIYKFDVAVTDADAVLTNISFTTNGTYITSNLTNIKLWYSPDATFTASGNDVLLRTKTTNLKTNPQTFTAFSQTITAGTTGYFFLTTDVVCTAGTTNTIAVNALTTSDLTITLGNKTGTAFASDAQTIINATPINVTGQATSACTNGGTTVSWTAPAGCSDAVLVFATSGSFTATLPTGNGGAYTANTAFGSGTAFDGGFCVYKNTGTTVNVTGLTNGTTYTYKIFTRSGSNWSSGVTVSCAPVATYCIPAPTSVDGIGITNVTMGTINNTTGAETGNYGNYSALSTNVEQGATLACNITYQTGFTYNTKIWVDWNNDIDFDDVGEEVYSGVSTASNPTTLNASFAVGGAVPIGSYRVRIGGADTNIPTPCYTGSFASFEDYTINVIAPCVPTHSITSFAPTTGSLGTWVTINGTGFTNASTVKFGSISATSVVYESTTKIYAQMPTTGATSTITVTEASCNVTTGASFTVINTSGVCSNGNFTDIFISEVYDADAGNTLYVELYNPTASPIDLTTSAYKIKIDNRTTSDVGVSVDRTVTLTGTIPANSIFLINIGTALNTCTNTWGFTESGPGINEADYIFLEKNGVDVDRADFPNETGYTYKRQTTATAPTATYSAGDWDISLTESCADLGIFNIFNPPTVSTITDASTCSLIDMTVTATSANAGVLTYKWFYNDRVATGWTEVNTTNLPNFTLTGQTTNSLKIADNVQLVSSISNYQFYCEVTENATCVKVSNASLFSTSSRPVYRSKVGVTGSWTSASNWEMANTTAGPWINACTYPIATNSTEVIIQNGTNITLSIDLAIDKVTIENGGTLEVATNAELGLSNENTGADLIVNGTFYYRSNSSNTMGFATGSTWSIASNGTLIKTNTSSAANLRDNYEGGISTIPATANFIFRYNGDGNISITTIGMFYPNLTFESTAGFWDGFTTASSFVGSTGGFATVKGNLDIGGTGTGTVKIYNENFNTQPLLILGNLTVRAGSTLTNDGITDLGASDSKGRGFELRGNLVVDGTLTVNATDVNVTSPILKFSGTAGEQTISGTGTLSIYELDVNKTATFDLKLLRNIAVSNLVDLQVGDINLNGFNIDMGTTAILSENVASDYLVKDLTATTEASVGGYIRFSNRNINNTQTSIGGSRLWLHWTSGADYTVNFDRYHYSANGKAIKLIYRVAVNSGTMGATNLRISYADYELFTLLETLNVARWASGTGWSSYIADVSDASANYAQRNGITAFSHWTLTDTNVLLASPEADLKATQVGKQTSLVQWANVAVGKTILQKSIDGLHFQDLAEADKEFTDNEFRQDAYYRLQTTHNAQVQYSKAVFLRYQAGEDIYLYPNPYKQGGQARLYVGDKTLQSLHILDVQGRTVGKTSENMLSHDFDALPAGTYILKVQTNKGIHYIRFVKL